MPTIAVTQASRTPLAATLPSEDDVTPEGQGSPATTRMSPEHETVPADSDQLLALTLPCALCRALATVRALSTILSSLLAW